MSYHNVNLHLTLRSGVIHVYAADDRGSRVFDETTLSVSPADVRRLAEALEADRRRDFQLVEPTQTLQDVESLLEDLGRRLSEALLPTRVSRRCASIHGHSVHPRQPMRLRLEIDVAGLGADLHAIPWECALDPEVRDHLVLRKHLSLVRLVGREGSDGPPKRPDRLKILAVAPRCPELVPVSVERELGQLDAAIRGKNVDLKVLRPPTLEALERRLREDDVHVVHYLGHGFLDAATGQGRICLEGEGGSSHFVTGRRFAEAFEGCTSVRLLFLNACRTAEASRDAPFAGVATAAIRQAGIAAVLAMQLPIRDSACVRFASEVYGALSDVDDLDRAVIYGRRSLRMAAREAGTHSWMIPVLFSRLDGCQLFAGSPDRGWARKLVAEPWRRAAGLAASVLLSLALVTGGWLWIGSQQSATDGTLQRSASAPSEAEVDPSEPGPTFEQAGVMDGLDGGPSRQEADLGTELASRPSEERGRGGEAPSSVGPTSRDDSPSLSEERADESVTRDALQNPRPHPESNDEKGEGGTNREPPRMQSLTEDRPLYFANLDATLSLELNRFGDQAVATLHLFVPGESISNQAVVAAETVSFDTPRGPLELDVVRFDEKRGKLDVLPLRATSH